MLRPLLVSAWLTLVLSRGTYSGLDVELVNSAEIQRKLTATTGYAQRLAASDKSHADLATEAFLRVLARRPRPEELKAAVDFLAVEPDLPEACRSLLWSLLATNEVLFNH